MANILDALQYLGKLHYHSKSIIVGYINFPHSGLSEIPPQLTSRPIQITTERSKQCNLHLITLFRTFCCNLYTCNDLFSKLYESEIRRYSLFMITLDFYDRNGWDVITAACVVKYLHAPRSVF